LGEVIQISEAPNEKKKLGAQINGEFNYINRADENK
jgi:hypothetical protein